MEGLTDGNSEDERVGQSMLEKFCQTVAQPHEIRAALGGALQLGLGVVEHTCAQTHTTVVALQDVVVDTPLASGPKFLVVGELRKGHGLIAHLRVEFHDGERGGDGENLGKRKSQTSQLESFGLDACSQAQSSELRIDNEARSGHIITMFPALDVAETYQPVVAERYYGFTALDLLGDILGRAAGDTRASLQCRFVDEVDYLLGIFTMLFFSKYNLDLIVVHLPVFKNRCREHTASTRWEVSGSRGVSLRNCLSVVFGKYFANIHIFRQL